MQKLSIFIKFLLYFSTLFLFSINNGFADNNIQPAILEHAKKSVVTIDSRVSVAAYGDVGNWSGTGFVADKTKGFIVTNAHVVGRASVGSYFVTFYNGKQSEAKVAFYDPIVDMAILYIEPSEIPQSVDVINFSKSVPKQNDSVLVVGNTEGQDFSFHTGYISALYEINGDMPQASYVINLNSAGGASGSPVLNDKNEAIGVLYGGGKTYVFALQGQYIEYALNALRNNQVPTRKHCGIITTLYSLDHAVRHRNFPKDVMDEYINKYPDARNKVISIQSIIPGSFANDILQAGDILWAVNNKPLAANLRILDSEMDSNKDSITLSIYRDGKKIEKVVKLYDLNQNKVQKMVDFAGAIFFESSDIISSKSGIPLNSLTLMNVKTGSSFSKLPAYFSKDNRNLYRCVIKSINNIEINNLEKLIHNIPNITQNKFINLMIKNYQPYFPNFDNDFISDHADLISDIVLDSIDTKPRILKYDNIKMGWLSEDIIQK